MGKVTKLLHSVSWVRGKCIGQGSFGTVSLGVDRSDGRVFAVKSVDRTACIPSQLEALENEIQILRSLSTSPSSSPYVVGYLGDDVSYENTTSYRNLHLEYLPRGTVADDVDESVVRSRIWCLVSALRYVHSRGIVHCDVKGKNVLVGPTPGHTKLADFGSAKACGMTGFAFGSGAPIFPRGSPLWMAPEVVRRQHQGPESDVWSLGCTLIEMLTGKPAWEDRGLDTLSRIGFSDELPEFPAKLSEAGRDFLEKCLRRDPAQRWSCDQLLEHPFLASAAPDSVANSSPRCVLDWVNSEFEDEEEEDDFESSEQALSAKGRIGKLASESGAIWESNGWTVVRSSSTSEEGERAGANCWEGHEGEGTSLEYSDLVRAEGEIVGTSSEYSDFRGSNLEYLEVCGNVLHEPQLARNCSCDGGLGCGGGGRWWCVAGSSCRHGLFQRVDLAVDRTRIFLYSLYIICLLLSSYSLILLFMKKFNIISSYIYILHLSFIEF